MEPDLSGATLEYYEHVASEYDSTSWEAPGQVHDAAEGVRRLLSDLPPVTTIDIGCGTGYVSRWLPGPLTLLDNSSKMLSIAKGRVPRAEVVQARVPDLPFPDRSFGRAFMGNFYGHLAWSERAVLVQEALRVADELIVLEQASVSGFFVEGPERRRLLDGSEHTIHKCYFTAERMLEELGGGEVLMDGPAFVIVRRAGPRA